MGDVKRAVILFSGRVQGVGFRFTTVHVAGDYKVSGFVRNEPDGSVRICAEGDKNEILGFIEAVKRSPVGRFIRSESIEWRPATFEFTGFEVRY